MDAEIRKKLEEMGKKSSARIGYLNPYKPELFRLDTAFQEGHELGAQAAWTLAVEWERARCARIMANAGSSEDDRYRAIGEILVPSEEAKP